MTDTLIAATGSAELRIQPDRATLHLAIRTTDPRSLRDAARLGAPLEREVIAALEHAGVPRDRVATLRYDTGQERYFAEKEKEYVYGDFYVEHVLAAEIHALDRIGAAITAARSAGATRVAGIAWWVSDEETYREQAARAAVQRAFARARTLAEAAGATLGRVVRLGTPEALAATLGAADAGGERHGMILSEVAALPDSGDDAEMDEDPLILPVPLTIEAVVHGAWEVTSGG